MSKTMIQATTMTRVRPWVWLERALWLAWIPLVLYVVFFAPIPDIHDGMHPLRHSSTLVQCH